MGVFPMAPIPAADHSISYDPVSAGYYADYGPLFAALRITAPPLHLRLHMQYNALPFPHSSM